MAQQHQQSGGNASVVFAGQRHLVFLLLSRSVAFRVSDTIGVSVFTRLWSYRGMRQIGVMEWKELRNYTETTEKYLCSNQR